MPEIPDQAKGFLASAVTPAALTFNSSRGGVGLEAAPKLMSKDSVVTSMSAYLHRQNPWCCKPITPVLSIPGVMALGPGKELLLLNALCLEVMSIQFQAKGMLKVEQRWSTQFHSILNAQAYSTAVRPSGLELYARNP